MALDKAQFLGKANFRLCRLCTWSNYNGLGFNLIATSQSPHLVRYVNSNSPASAGGLQIRDVLLAINNQDVSEAEYRDVVNMIRHAVNSNGAIELHVIQQRFYKPLKKKCITFDHQLAEIFETPRIMPTDYKNFPKHTPRTCEIYLSETDQSFGFEVVEGENDIGLYIQEVISNSPADRTSLRKSDRIIEIDEKFVDNERSEFLLEKLCKAKSKRIMKLYVVDTDTYKYFKENNIPLSSKEYLQTPLAKKLSINSYTSQHESPC